MSVQEPVWPWEVGDQRLSSEKKTLTSCRSREKLQAEGQGTGAKRFANLATRIAARQVGDVLSLKGNLPPCDFNGLAGLGRPFFANLGAVFRTTRVGELFSEEKSPCL